MTRLIFDADDTLWHCQRYFEEARQDYREVLLDEGLPEDAPISETLKTIDEQRVEEYGYAKNRFYESMILAYETLCEQYGLEPSETTKDQLESIGLSVYREPGLYDHTLDTLRRLKQTGARMMVLTGGEEEVQRPKFDSLQGYQNLFETIHVVNHKDEEEWERAARQLGGPEQTWAIGNSLRSDIHPALRVGLNAVHVPRGQWYYEQTDVERSGYHEADNLQEVLNVLDRHTSLAIPSSEPEQVEDNG